MFFRCFFCTVRLSIFERFVFPKGSKFNRLVWDSLEIWKCGLYKFYNQPLCTPPTSLTYPDLSSRKKEVRQYLLTLQFYRKE